MSMPGEGEGDHTDRQFEREINEAAPRHAAAEVHAQPFAEVRAARIDIIPRIRLILDAENRGVELAIHGRERARARQREQQQWQADQDEGQANADAVPVYTIFTNDQLAEMAKRRCSSLAALAEIDGVGQGRIEKYGQMVLAMLTGNNNGE